MKSKFNVGDAVFMILDGKIITKVVTGVVASTIDTYKFLYTFERSTSRYDDVSFSHSESQLFASRDELIASL